MEITKLSSKGQLVIPKNVRKDAKISSGDVLAVDVIDEFIVMKKVDADIPKKSMQRAKTKFSELEEMLYSSE